MQINFKKVTVPQFDGIPLPRQPSNNPFDDFEEEDDDFDDFLDAQKSQGTTTVSSQ